MFFGQFEGEWAYYDGGSYRKLNEAHPYSEWHGGSVLGLIENIKKIVSAVNLGVTREEVLDVFVPKTLICRLLEVCPKPKRGMTHDYSRFFWSFDGTNNSYSNIILVDGARELRYSMDSTDSWPPLDASKNTLQGFFDAAFDKNRTIGLFATLRDSVDIEVLFEQPTSHPKFRVWIRFLFQRILAREWEKHVMVAKGAAEDEVYGKFWDKTIFLQDTLVEWKKSPKWEPLTPNDCPVSYKFGSWKGSIDFEYERVVIPQHLMTPPEKKPKADPEPGMLPSSPKAADEKDTPSTIHREEKISEAMVKSENIKEIIENDVVKKEDIELANMEVNSGKAAKEKIKEEPNSEVVDFKKVAKAAKIKEEHDLEVVCVKKVAKPWGGKRRFEDVEEFQRAINHPSVTKKPRYRAVTTYEILDSDEE